LDQIKLKIHAIDRTMTRIRKFYALYNAFK